MAEHHTVEVRRTNRGDWCPIVDGTEYPDSAERSFDEATKQGFTIARTLDKIRGKASDRRQNQTATR
jgi:hypothetical protein